MEQPLPFEKAVKVLMAMDRESYLYMYHRKNPIPLLQMAVQRGFSHLSYQDTKGIWHILITKKEHTNLEELLEDV